MYERTCGRGGDAGILDRIAHLAVEYKYDAWSKIIGRMGSLASTLGYFNPFRYRGYVYDEETGLYYLRSRYYNPEWGRFINADVLLGKRGALLSHNLFAYCASNPVIFKDEYGYAMVCCFDENGNIHPFMSLAMSGGGGGYNGFIGGYTVIDTVRYMDKEDWAREGGYFMEASLTNILELALQQGIWAALYIYLFFRVLSENKEREDKYQTIIDRLSGNIEQGIEDIQERLEQLTAKSSIEAA